MKGTLAIFRLAFLVSLFVGLGGMFKLFAMSSTLLDVHIVTGLIMFVSAIWLALETKNVTLIIAALLILGGALVAVMSKASPLTVGIFHMVVLVVAYVLGEVGARQSLRMALH